MAKTFSLAKPGNNSNNGLTLGTLFLKSSTEVRVGKLHDYRYTSDTSINLVFPCIIVPIYNVYML